MSSLAILAGMVMQSIMISDGARHAVLARVSIWRCGEPSEIASVAAFRASEDASFTTSQTVYVDGGRMAQRN